MKRIASLTVFAWIAVASAVSPLLCHAQAVVTGAGYSTPSPTSAAPGQVITIFVRVPGKTPAAPVTATPPLPATLAGFTVLLRQTFPSVPLPVPILSAVDAQSCTILAPSACDTVSMITVQVPFELTPNAPATVPPVSVPQNFARLEISYNGNPADSLILNPVLDRIHVLNTCDTAAASSSQPARCLPEVARPDGSLVSNANPAQPGEVLTVSVVGLGSIAAGLTVATGAAAPQPGPAVEGVLVDFDIRVNASPAILIPSSSLPANSAQLQAGSVGIYHVAFTAPSLPPGTLPCGSTVQSNLTIDIGRTASYDGVGICVDPPAMPLSPGSRGRNRK